MYQRLYPILFQIRLQFIALAIGNKNREQMIYVLSIGQAFWQRDLSVFNAIVVHLSNLLTVSVVLIQIFQLNIQHRSLNLIKTAVPSSIFESHNWQAYSRLQPDPDH